MGVLIGLLLAICDSVGPPHKKSCVTAKISVTFVTSVDGGLLPSSMLRSQRAGRHQVHSGLLNHFTQRHRLLGLAPFLIVLWATQATAAENSRDLGSPSLDIIANAA